MAAYVGVDPKREINFVKQAKAINSIRRCKQRMRFVTRYGGNTIGKMRCGFIRCGYVKRV
jgi:hypothetical protein